MTQSEIKASLLLISLRNDWSQTTWKATKLRGRVLMTHLDTPVITHFHVGFHFASLKTNKNQSEICKSTI